MKVAPDFRGLSTCGSVLSPGRQIPEIGLYSAYEDVNARSARDALRWG